MSKYRSIDIDQYESKSSTYDGCGTWPCRLCGKELKGPQHYTFHEIEGGGTALHVGDEARYNDDGGDLGFQSIGTT